MLAGHATQATPFDPQAMTLVPVKQVAPEQHPAGQVAALQLLLHTPFEQA
ncbi:MAG TPA: hypothetical protein VKQ32_13015 [Polyangia bacterium]|nr:hypothetical protein [Polyangia bacterium]